ncbi:YihY family protein [Clostridiales bacterium 1_7_47FAA]|nr:YihY family protein [Clostridiales bacterium 1_7_47FAA]
MFMFGLIVAVKQVYDKYAEDEMTVYAAQVSFFIILSVVPFIMLLLTAVQMIPSISNAQFMELIVGLVPVDYKSLAFRVVNDLSLKSPATMISVTAITALWSAGRGMFSVARGLNRVHGHGEKRWYVVGRLICSGYTIVFILVCILSLGLLVFGNMIQAFMVNRFPIVADVVTHIINFRALWALMILIMFFLGIYTFVPDKKLKLQDQIPGAVFSTVGWMAFSFAFSLYFNHIGGRNYSYMYGSLTAIVLLLLWLYMCMCILFFGAEINYYWKELFGRE